LIDELLKAVRYGEERGLDYVEARLEDITTESIQYLNGRVKEVGYSRSLGVGIRVVHRGRVGFASVDSVRAEDLRRAVDEAISAARAARGEAKMSPYKPVEATFDVPGVRRHPSSVEVSEKIADIRDLHRMATDVCEASKHGYFTPSDFEVKNVTIRYASVYGEVAVVSSEGARVVFKPLLTGLALSVVALREGVYGDGSAVVGGSVDYEGVRREAFERAYEATWKAGEKTVASPPPPGRWTVISYPEVTGLFAHESFGHMSEGDFVASGSSPLGRMVGEAIASEAVTIADEGTPKYRPCVYLPVDSEGVVTRRVELVERGVMKGFLHSRFSAGQLNTSSTGNGRAESHRHEPIVRMRNTFFEAGDWGEDEILSEFRSAVIVDDGRGGQAELDGTFTFSASRGYVVEGGERKKPIRDIILSGNILELLKNVVAAGREVRIDAAPFGACGKGGQSVYVGLGGPILVIRDMPIGGR